MKTKLTSLLILFTFLIVNSQTKEEKEKLFKKQLNNVVNSYEGYNYKDKTNGDRIVQDKLLNKRISNAFNQVVFGSSSLVDNATAFGVSLNKEKTKVSVSTNFHLIDYGRDQLYIKVGMNAGGSGGLFDLYSNNEWQNSVGGSVGLIFKFKGSGFSNENKNKLQYDKTLRKLYIQDSIKKILIDLKKEDYKTLRSKYITAIKDRDKKLIEKHYDSLKKVETLYKLLEKSYDKKDNKKLDFDNYNDSEKNKDNDEVIANLIDGLWKVNSNDNKMLLEVIKEVANAYDTKNIKNTGYSFWWVDANLTMNNNTFNFSEEAENIDSDVLDDFNNLDKKKTGINKLKTVVSANLNYSSNTKYKGAWFLQGGFTYNSGSFLGSNLVNGTAKVSELNNGLFLIKDEDENVIGDFNSIDKSLEYGSIDFYGAHFFGKKKVFGLNLAFSHRYSIKTPQNSFYKNNYSLFFGPVFRTPKKDGSTGATFSLDFGLENAVYDSNDDVGENFVGRIRVGIPFKLFDIK